MQNIQSILHQINQDLVPQFEEKLRQSLATQSKDWLIDQIVRLTLDAHSLRQMDHKQILDVKAKARAERIARVRQMELNPQVLSAFLEKYEPFDREMLIQSGKEVTLPPPPPLRTERDCFQSFRSSRKDAFFKTRSSNREILGMNLVMTSGMKEHQIAGLLPTPFGTPHPVVEMPSSLLRDRLLAMRA